MGRGEGAAPQSGTMGFSISQGAGRPPGKTEPSINTRITRRTVSRLPASLITFAKMQTWQIMLAFLPLLVGAAAYNEDRWASFDEIPAGLRSETSGLSPFQNSTSGLKMGRQNVRNHSREGHPALQENLYTRSIFINDIKAADQAHTVNTRLNSEKISASTGLESGKGLPSADSSVLLQMDHSSSQVLHHTASLTLARTADVSVILPSNRFKEPEDSMTSSIGPQGMDPREMASRTSPHPTSSPASLLLDLKSTLHSDSNTAHQTVLGHDSASLNIDSSIGNTVLTSKQLSATHRSFSRQQLQSQNTLSSWQTLIPTTVESPDLSALPASRDGTSRDPEHYKEGLLSSDFNYGRHTAKALHARGQLSAVPQGSSVENNRQSSKATAELPSRKENIPVASHSSTVESFLDLANSSITQLAKVNPTPAPHPDGVGSTGFNFSLAIDQLDPDTTAFSTPTEVNVFPRQKSSELKEHLTGSDMTSPPLYLDTTKEHKDSSLVTYDMMSASLGEGPKLEMKEGISPVGEDHTDPRVVSTPDITNVKSGATSFGSGLQSWQPPTLLPLSTLNHRDVRTEYSVPLVQVSPSKTMSSTVSYKETVDTEVSRRKEEITAAAAEVAVFSELLLTTFRDTPRVRLSSSLISEEPEVGLGGQHYTLPRKRSETTTPTPLDSSFVPTSRIMSSSKEPKPETLVVSLTTKKATGTIAHTLTPETDAVLASHPYLNREEVTLPTGPAFAGLAHANLQTGSPTSSPVAEFLSETSPEWNSTTPSSLYDVASLLNLPEPEESSVVPAHSSLSLSFTSLGSTNSSLPASNLKIHTERLMARKEQVVSVVTEMSLSLQEELWRSSSTSPTTASTVYRGAPLLPTKMLHLDLDTATVAPTEVVPLTTAVTSLDIHRPHYADSSGSKAPVYTSISEAQSTQVVTVSSSSTAPLTDQKSLPVDVNSVPCSNISCMVRTPPVPSQNTSAQPSISYQPSLTKKVSASMLGSAEGRKNVPSTVNISEMTILKEISTMALLSGKTVTLIQGGYALEERVSKFKNPVMSRSARKEHLTPLGISASPVPAVHILPLWFRLTGINYTESLENKSSESYMKLEKEVKLTLNKMLSNYENFLQTNVLRFLNDSLFVLSEAVFRAGPTVPTPSDTIRTIVTEVETKRLDAFFDWRIDVQSLRSNGISLSNLEPETLALSFTVLGLRPWLTLDSLESLRKKVIFLLGARYTVQNISLVEIRNIEAGIDISGEIYIDTNIHVDIGWALQALMGLSNDSVDLTSLSINGSRLSLRVFPVSFLVTNRIFDEKMMDRSSAEHQDLVRDLTDVLMHILGKYKNFLQVAIRDITGGSLVCHGDVIFQPPAPTSKDVLQTLALSVGPKDYLDSSGLQVDPLSFTVAGDGLDPPFTNLGIPSYGVAVIILCVLVLIVLPILALLPKILGRKDKIIISRAHDPEAGVETFELDNPGFRSAVEEVHVDCLNSNVMMTDSCTLHRQQFSRTTTVCSDEGMMSHSI
ncbi:uncharacterized protein LOC110090533 isoform X3 [Pogona vitticeps]